MMNKYKAVFFDRDGTLTYFNPEKNAWRDKIISSWSGKPFELSYDKMIALFLLASEDRKPWYKTLDDERVFSRRYYRHMLIDEGVTEELDERAELLFSELWCNNDRLLFPETVEVLEYFHRNGYKMGIISDTSPSLEYTLQQLGIAKYFTSFTASSLVGASKPSPIIFNAALSAQDVTAGESLYVDDYKPEADGAREQGFTSFLIDRSEESKDEWTITSLTQLVEYAEKDKKSEIDYYKSLPCAFNGFIDFPELTDGEVSLVCTAKKPAVPEKKYVPAYEFAICTGITKVGEVNLRVGYSGFGPDNSSLYYGGQVGYGIDEKYRGKGYAGKACRLLCHVAKAHGMTKLLITNDMNNITSRRVCEKLGLHHVRCAKLPEWTDLYQEGQRYVNIYEMDTEFVLKMTKLSTERCHLTRLSKADFDEVIPLFTNAEVRHYLGGPVSAEWAYNRLIKSLTADGEFRFVVRLKENRACIGLVFVTPHHNPTDMELSYLFMPAFWGKGYAYEAVNMLVLYCRDELKLNRVVSETQTANTHSCRLLERLGYVLESKVERFGAEQSIYVYEFTWNKQNEAEILKAISEKYGIPTGDAAIYSEPVRTGRTNVNKLTVNIGDRTFRLIEKCFADDTTELMRYKLLRDYDVETAGVFLIDADGKRLVIEDLSDIAVCGNSFDEPTADGDFYRAALGEVVCAAARFHAAFWDNYAAFGRVGLPWQLENAENYNEQLAGMKRDLHTFTELFPGRLTGDELECFERALVSLGENIREVIDNRFNAGKNITVVHGDLHPGNTFVSRSGKIRFIDMEAVRMGLPTDDLAMLLALHAAPGKEAERYLEQYYAELSKSVGNYSYDELIGDYKLSVAQTMFHLIGVVGVRMNICDTDMLRRAVKSYRTLETIIKL